MPVIFGRDRRCLGMRAATVKAARKAAAKNLEFILHLEMCGRTTINRFGMRAQTGSAQFAARTSAPAAVQCAHASQPLSLSFAVLRCCLPLLLSLPARLLRRARLPTASPADRAEARDNLQAAHRDQHHRHAAGQRHRRQPRPCRSAFSTPASRRKMCTCWGPMRASRTSWSASAPRAQPTEKPVLFLCHIDVVRGPALRLAHRSVSSSSRRTATTTAAARRT